MNMPLWTIADNEKDLSKCIETAGFTSIKIVGEMHMFRASDAREGDITEGLSPIQVVLDQAAHLMDAVAVGSKPGGWDGAREELAQKYKEGGYPDMADFINSV